MLVDFHSLFERYSRDVYRFALYLSGDPSLAEEINQETFVRAWITPEEIRGGSVKAYLLTIARNLYRAERKRAARHVAIDGALPDPKPSADKVVDFFGNKEFAPRNPGEFARESLFPKKSNYLEHSQSHENCAATLIRSTTPPDEPVASWRDADGLEFLKPHREIINRLKVVDDLRRTFGIADLNVKVWEVARRVVAKIARVGVVGWVNPDDPIGGDPSPTVDGHSRGNVEFNGHSIGSFGEHLKETLVDKLVDLRWHGVALADVAHWSVFRLGEKMSVKVSDGGWRMSA